MTDELGVVVSLGSWRAVVHYTDCPYWGRRLDCDIPIPGRMPVVLCSLCRPTKEDLINHTPHIQFYDYSPATKPGVKYRQVEMSTNHLENVNAQHDLGLGRTPKKSTMWQNEWST